MPIAYAYSRFSSPAQAEGDSVRRQLASAQTYADANDLTLDTTLQDHGVSAFKGRNREIGALGSFLRRVEAGEIESGSYLLLDSMDRLTREAVSKAFRLLLDILDHGIVVVTLNDLRVYQGEPDMVSLVIALVQFARAHDESAEKSRKVKAARAEERRLAIEEKRPFTPRGPHWLQLDMDGFAARRRADPDASPWVILEDRAETVRDLFALKEAGWGYAAIARDLNGRGIRPPRPRATGTHTWTEGTVRDLVRSPALVGTLVLHARDFERSRRREPVAVVDGFYPPIIDRSRWDAVQATIVTRQNPQAKPRSPLFFNLLVGHVRCGGCGGTVGFLRSTHPERPAWRAVGVLRCPGVYRGVCDERARLPIDKVEAELVPVLAGLPDLRRGSARPSVAAAVRAELAAVDRAIEGLLVNAEAGAVVLDRLHERQREREGLEARLADLKRAEQVELMAASGPDWREQWRALTSQMETAEGTELYSLRARLNALIGRAVPAGFLFKSGHLFARQSDSDAVFYGVRHGLIRWGFGPHKPTFSQLRAAFHSSGESPGHLVEVRDWHERPVFTPPKRATR